MVEREGERERLRETNFVGDGERRDIIAGNIVRRAAWELRTDEILAKRNKRENPARLDRDILAIHVEKKYAGQIVGNHDEGTRSRSSGFEDKYSENAYAFKITKI